MIVDMGPETIVMVVLTKDGQRDGDTVRSAFTAPIGAIMLQQLTVDLSTSPTAVSFPDPEVAAGGRLPVDLEITNLGGADSPDFQVYYYLTDDNVLDTGDDYLGAETFSGPAGYGTVNELRELVIPGSTVPGSYRIGWIVDPTSNALDIPPPPEWGAVGESDENHASNRAVSAFQIQVFPPCPDLDSDDWSVCDPGCRPAGDLGCGDCDDLQLQPQPRSARLLQPRRRRLRHGDGQRRGRPGGAADPGRPRPRVFRRDGQFDRGAARYQRRWCRRLRRRAAPWRLAGGQRQR